TSTSTSSRRTPTISVPTLASCHGATSPLATSVSGQLSVDSDTTSTVMTGRCAVASAVCALHADSSAMPMPPISHAAYRFETVLTSKVLVALPCIEIPPIATASSGREARLIYITHKQPRPAPVLARAPLSSEARPLSRQRRHDEPVAHPGDLFWRHFLRLAQPPRQHLDRRGGGDDHAQLGRNPALRTGRRDLHRHPDQFLAH